jgi:hypothetical protein
MLDSLVGRRRIKSKRKSRIYKLMKRKTLLKIMDLIHQEEEEMKKM